MVSTALAATLLTITLSNDGHWLSQHTGAVAVEWALPDHAIDAELRWTLTAGAATLAEGRLELPANEPGATLRLRAPAVRVRTPLRWRYTLHAMDDERELAEGERTVHLYPDTQLAGVAERLDEPVAVLAEADAPLVQVLEHADVRHRRVERAAALQLDPPRRMLVPANRLSEGPDEAAALRRLARAGAGVMIFEQRDLDRLMGFRLRRRPAPERLQWRDEHALVQRFDAADRASWLASAKDVWAIAVPVDEPALALAAWPTEMDALEPAPVDALVLTQTLGRGRIVLWQAPLGPWDSDPRSQRLLAHALDYLGTRSGPTPALVDRMPRKPDRAAQPQDQVEPHSEGANQ